MRLLLPELSDAEMADLAESLRKGGYPGGIQALAAEARDWIAECEWADLGEEDIEDLTDAQALSGAGRKVAGGLEEFISLGGYPPAASQ